MIFDAFVVVVWEFHFFFGSEVVLRFIYLFIHLLALKGLRYDKQGFSSRREQGLLLTAVASLIVEHGL